MAIVNFAIPATLEKQIKQIIKTKGFASKAEFFRFAAHVVLKNYDEPVTIDEIIHEARRDYLAGNYETADSAEELIRKLKS